MVREASQDGITKTWYEPIWRRRRIEDLRLTLVNTVMTLRVLQIGNNFSTRLVTISFSRTMLHGISQLLNTEWSSPYEEVNFQQPAVWPEWSYWRRIQQYLLFGDPCIQPQILHSLPLKCPLTRICILRRLPEYQLVQADRQNTGTLTTTVSYGVFYLIRFFETGQKVD